MSDLSPHAELRHRIKKRKGRDMRLMWLCAGVSIGVLTIEAAVLGAIGVKGWAGLTREFFTNSTSAPGLPSGIQNSFIGTFYTSLIAMALATPIGIMAGTYMSEYAPHERIAKAFKLDKILPLLNDTLLSNPSIINGIFIWGCLVVPLGKPPSAFTGAMALATIALPIIAQTTYNGLKLVSNQFREMAYHAGMPTYMATAMVMWPVARKAMITGAAIALARITGETAPLLFAAASSQFLELNPFHAMSTLSLALNDYAGNGSPAWEKLAWSTAWCMTLTLLTLSVIAKINMPEKKVRPDPAPGEDASPAAVANKDGLWRRLRRSNARIVPMA